MAQKVRFVNRKGWEAGPWDDEPDVLHEPPILLHRQSSGGWGAMVAISKEHRDAAAEFIHKQGQVKLDNRLHTLSLIEFDEKSRGSDAVDLDKSYIGFFYDAPTDMRPSGTQYIKDLPDYMRGPYLGHAQAGYVTAQRAKMYAELLARVLSNVGIAPVDARA